MNGKIVMITGANSGIGKETAVGLARLGAKIIMVCRNKEKGEIAKKEIIEKSNSPDIELMIADLEDQESIKALVNEFKKNYESLDVLINNAGLIIEERTLTPEGYERTFAINHLGHFLLTNLLLDLIKKSAPSRIINVSSAAHMFADFDLNDLHSEKKYRAFRAYANSKLANILFTNELSKKLKGTGVTVNSLHPGTVRTNFGNGNPLFSLVKIFLISPQKGAETSVYLASSPEVEGITGEYFSKSKITKSSKVSRDEELARDLWEVSLKMVGLEA